MLENIANYQILISTIIAVCAFIYKIYHDRAERKSKESASNFQEYYRLIETFYGISSHDGRVIIPMQKLAVYSMKKYKEYDSITLNLLIDWLDVLKQRKDSDGLSLWIEETLSVIKNRRFK